jgi:GH25 family lysozyme M1 (1,4-beta-N-acetylmuramidase)
MLNGIDVSTYQRKVNWERAKPNIDFAIIRCGFGSDYAHQDDNQFARNVAECERLNIPFGVYLYSYATTAAMIESEVAHTLRLISGHKPFCVFIDMEDGSTASLGKATLTAFAKKFCEAVKAKGFNVGVYANQNWFRNYLDVKALRECGYAIWCAKYSTEEPKIDAEFDIWQYSSSGSVDGIEGRVDMNKMYNDIRGIKAEARKTIDELAQEVWQGKWGNGEERKQRLTAAGYDYSAVQKRVEETAPKKEAPKAITKGSIVRVKKGAKTYNGKSLASFVYDRNHVVAELNGDRAVITFGGVVVCGIHKDNLYLV